MPPVEQSYANHRRFQPLYHYFVVPALALNCLLVLYFAIRRPNVFSAWNAIVAAALLALAAVVRVNAVVLQNRIIRVEETLRLNRCLPEDLRARIGSLTPSQLVALRFCGDEQLPDLTRSVLEGEVSGADSIKKCITAWRADHLRV